MHGKQAFGQTHEYIKVKFIKVHPKIQRAFDQPRATKISTEFDPLKFGSLSVIENGHGNYLAFDGQHRLWAVKDKFGEDQMVPCHVFKDLPLEKQAATSLGLNDQKAWKPGDKWSNRRIALDNTVLDVERILKQYGLKVAPGAQNGTVRAVAALEDIYRKPKGAELLNRTMYVITQAWGTGQDGLDNIIMRGLSFLFIKAGAQLNDDQALAQKLASHGTPRKLVGEARDYAEFSRISASRAMAQVIANTWNKRRREDQTIKL